VKSATIRSPPLPRGHRNFNPRTREECDINGNGMSDYPDDFNPRTREECD